MPILESSTDDVLGLWANVPIPGPVSFGIGEEAAPPDHEVYRANLPADLAEARQALEDSHAALTRMDSALNDIPDRLDGLVTRTQMRQSGGVSFALETQPQEFGPEADLLQMLGEAERGSQASVSFGLGDLASDAWAEAKERLKSMAAQIDRDVLHFAWVETSISGDLIARSTIDWTGDLETQWQTDITPEQSSLHENSLMTAARTRHHIEVNIRKLIPVATPQRSKHGHGEDVLIVFVMSDDGAQDGLMLRSSGVLMGM